jgi:hypothetical protein
MPGSLHPWPESHSIFIRRNSFLHHTRGHWLDDADTQNWIHLPFQSWNHNRVIPEIIFSSKSPDIWIVLPIGRSASQIKSPVSFLPVLRKGKPSYLITLLPAWLFFRWMGGWTYIRFFVHFLYRGNAHHSVQLQHLFSGQHSQAILKIRHRGHVLILLHIGLHVCFLSGRQVLFLDVENGQGWEAASGDILDFVAQAKFHRVQF